MNKDLIYMNIAEEISKSSKCISRKVGAILVKEDRILSTGYNGTPKGFVNCCEHWNNTHTKEHHHWSSIYEIHAEMNCIIWSARVGVNIEGSVLYCTTEPCKECSKNLIASGITRIVYRDTYPYNVEDREDIDNLLKLSNIKKERIINE